MAACHVRSTSWPDEDHPISKAIKEHLIRLSEPQATHSSSSASCRLGRLKELYDLLDDFIRLPLVRRALSREHESEYSEGVSVAFLRLLDVCGMTRDLLVQRKERVQELESSLRRRRSEGDALACEIEAYMAARKASNKSSAKYFKASKKTEKHVGESDTTATLKVLKEVEEISLAAFESLLSFVCQSKTRSRRSSWSVLLHSKHDTPNEMEVIDEELQKLKSSKDVDVVRLKKVLKGLQALDLNFREMEEELECVYRRLIRVRVSLLNILNN